MRVIEITYHTPVNRLIASLQNYCRMLMSDPEKNSIHNLGQLNQKLQGYIKGQQAVFPRCKAEKLDAVLTTNVLHEWYNLLYCEQRSMITVFSRPDDVEAAFRDYDLLKYSGRQQQ